MSEFRFWHRVAALAGCALLVFACGRPADEHAGSSGDGTLPDHGPRWGYEGEAGPGLWGALDATFIACDAGRAQSPIDIAATELGSTALVDPELEATGGGELEPAYRPVELRVVNNGHTLQMATLDGGALVVNAGQYALRQLHFHAPSEHTLDGRSFPAELHLVHEDGEGRLAVVGVLFEEGAANSAYDPLLEELPAAAGEESFRAGVTFDPGDLLPADLAHYLYDGSLTTPPCSEGVTWRVLASPVQLSRDQIDALSAILLPNNRPTQPLGGRRVRLIR